jgi:hypothetical protein
LSKVYQEVKMFKLLVIISLCQVTLALQKLEPTKIVNNGLYRLEIQSEDKFLSSSKSGTPMRTRWASRPDQKWTFTNEDQGWKLTPLSGQPRIPNLWKISYVGHGKYRFLNEVTQMCLAGYG